VPPDAPHRRLDLTAIAVVLVLAGALGVWSLTRDDGAGFRGALPSAESPASPTVAPKPVAAASRGLEATGSELIRAENAKPGNPEWAITDGDDRPRGIEGFTDRVSGQQGDTVRLFVNTAAPSFQVTAYRLGHYNGAGARQVWQSPTIPGTDQPDCRVEDATKMVDCSNWAPSLSVAIDEAFPGGQYLFKLVPENGSSSFVPYVVREDDRDSAVLVVSDVTTLQAYNRYGGHSLYGGSGGRSTVVSFDRPMDTGWAMSGILGDSYNIGVMVESMGLDVSYSTSGPSSWPTTRPSSPASTTSTTRWRCATGSKPPATRASTSCSWGPTPCTGGSASSPRCSGPTATRSTTARPRPTRSTASTLPG
jgi:hypothetical protein